MNYINAHATSTLVGDVAEVKAIKKVFSDVSNLRINSTKSMIGHCLGAAGGMEAIATLQAIRTGWVHPTLNQACSPTLILMLHDVNSPHGAVCSRSLGSRHAEAMFLRKYVDIYQGVLAS